MECASQAGVTQAGIEKLEEAGAADTPLKDAAQKAMRQHVFGHDLTLVNWHAVFRDIFGEQVSQKFCGRSLIVQGCPPVCVSCPDAC